MDQIQDPKLSAAMRRDSDSERRPLRPLPSLREGKDFLRPRSGSRVAAVDKVEATSLRAWPQHVRGEHVEDVVVLGCCLESHCPLARLKRRQDERGNLVTIHCRWNIGKLSLICGCEK